MIKLGFIEDDIFFRNNLVKYFGFIKDFEVVFDVETVDKGIANIKNQSDIQILILDIGLPGISGLEGLPLLKESKPDLDIIMLTSYEEEAKILKALCSGACSYISKKSKLDEIEKAIRIVDNGGSYMSPSIAREIVHYFVNGEVKEPVIKLSDRQKEIMDRMIDGKTYNTIAKELFISVDTVRYHIKNLYKSLHAKNKAEAIVNYLKGNF